MLRDKVTSSTRDITDTADLVTRDARNRARGWTAKTNRLLDRQQPSDANIYHQVKAEISTLSRHPGAIDVELVDGTVTLRGPILRDEVKPILAAVRRVAGVEAVNEEFEIHDEPGKMPALQGEGRLGSTTKPEFLQQHWAPAPRAVFGAIGGALCAYGLRRRGMIGTSIAATGSGLLARAATNLPLRRLTGVGADHEAVHLEKTIDIDAPVDKVWSFVDDYQSFPTFMSHVLDVQADDEGRSHWKVEGPLGATMEWDADVTERKPNEVLAWESRPGTAVQHAGMVSLEPTDGGSRVHVRLSYNPAAGAAGHAVAHLLGANPKKQLDDDLLRMKTMIETGKRPHDAAQG